MIENADRFTNRVADYVKYRPDYPREIVDFLHERCELAAGAPVADVGAGTGISSRLFLEAGHSVVAVEPNEAMRAAADGWLAGYPSFRSVAGTAEATTLADASVDLVIAAQAFHWFDTQAAQREFARIARPRGLIALFWNSRRLDGTPFLAGYEALLQRYAVDYKAVAERYADDDVLAAWFGQRFVHRAVFPNRQRFDFDGLRGRLSSSSYVPKAGHPNYEPMMAAARELFDANARDGLVELVYDTRVYAGYARDA